MNLYQKSKNKENYHWKRHLLFILLLAFSLNSFAGITAANQQSVLLRGKVVDSSNEPLIGVSVYLKSNPKIGTSTDESGQFTINSIKSTDVVVLTYLGMKTKEVSVSYTATGGLQVIKMESSEMEIGTVVVIGDIQRKKENFTGAAKIVSGKDLLGISTQNAVQSLKTLDPSFVVLDNNLLGSNPNALPDIQLRGATGLSVMKDAFGTNPNQPLFILDGFETSLQAIMDLDPNRIASMTVLKDASSTSMYGAKAANGVVVVETKKPSPGKLRLDYSGDFSLDFPDLNSYNMMNAAEKLEFERLSGRFYYGVGTIGTNTNFDGHPGGSGEIMVQAKLDSLYYARLADVKRGVDSYWLSDPVRTAFSNRQAVQVSGGSNDLLINGGLSFRNQEGVMKESGRQTWSTNLDFQYRKSKINIINKASASGYVATESPYGSFQDYVNTNPYYTKTNPDGSMPRFLEKNVSNSTLGAYNVANPLYNASLNSKDEAKNTTIGDNFMIKWNISDAFRLEGALSGNKTLSTHIVFVAPEHTKFEEKAYTQKGTYDRADNSTLSYLGNLMLTYFNTFGKHQVTANARTEAQKMKAEAFTSYVEGFPMGTNGSPAFAYSFKQNSAPYYSKYETARNSFMVTANYVFDQRYLLDANYRIDGASNFGSTNQYAPFYGVGLGWNLHRESFMKDQKWLNLFKLRGSVGTSANQNVNFITSTIYGYSSAYNIFGTGLLFNTLGNPDMGWSKTRTTGVGIDMTAFSNRLNMTVDVYDKYTDPMGVYVQKAPSTGVSSYPMNIGHLNTRGFEFDLSYALIDNNKDLRWTIKTNGYIIREELGGLGEIMNSANTSMRTNQYLTRFLDGHSQSDLWAVKSLGIDPATGSEVFLSKDGNRTFTYSAADEVKVGCSTPDISGVFGTTLVFKQLTVQCFLRYSLGGEIFNSALYNKVENISFSDVAYNQDRRALYGRWKNPGDIAQFKAISILTSTPMSSRFVQTQNLLRGESANVSWMFKKYKWMNSIGLQGFTLSANMNEFFYLSNVKVERGTSYPFSRSVSFSVKANF